MSKLLSELFNRDGVKVKDMKPIESTKEDIDRLKNTIKINRFEEPKEVVKPGDLQPKIDENNKMYKPDGEPKQVFQMEPIEADKKINEDRLSRISKEFLNSKEFKSHINEETLLIKAKSILKK